MIRITISALLSLACIVNIPMAGPTVTEMTAIVGKEFENSQLVLRVKVKKVIEKPQEISSGYLKNCDMGPFIKTKIHIVYAHCIILEVLKNDTSTAKRINAQAGEEFVATFEKQVKGPANKTCYIEDYKKPPKTNAEYSFFFESNHLRGLQDIKATKDIDAIALYPSFVRRISD